MSIAVRPARNGPSRCVELSPLAVDLVRRLLDQFELVGEIENRYALWGQPGKIKVTAYLERGRMGSYQNALDYAQATGVDVSDALAAVRTYQSRPGLSVNLEQQVSDTVGFFARAGWADGNVEPWDNAKHHRWPAEA